LQQKVVMASMCRRRLVLLAGAVALLGVAGFTLFLWLTTPSPGVTWENYRRLRIGMSAGYVEALLGEPRVVNKWGDGTTSKIWWNEEVRIWLSFDADGLTFGVAFTPELGEYPSFVYLHTDQDFLDRIRRLLHW
jgi:hypothetical protein